MSSSRSQRRERVSQGLWLAAPGLAPASLVAPRIREQERSILAAFGSQKFVLTHKARVAVDLCCQVLQLGPGDEVLMPAYHCGSEVDPFLSRQIRVSLYSVNRRFEACTDDLFARLRPTTRAVYLIHYFGWPQPALLDIAAGCRQRGIPLIEDCALGLLSGTERGPLGADGDLAVFSFPKTLPVPDGGAWVVGRWTGTPPSVDRGAPLVAPLLNLARLLRRRIRRRASSGGAGTRPVATAAPESEPAFAKKVGEDSPGEAAPLPMPANYYFDRGLRGRRMSRVGVRLLGTFDAGEIRAKRRRNYARLAELLTGCPGIEPALGPLPERVCPLVFPMLVRDRTGWVSRLRRRGVDAVPWWAGFHSQLDLSEYPDARYLKSHLLTLPIHQDLEVPEVEAMGGLVRELAAGG